MKTQLEYLQQTNQYSGEATILAQGCDESGYFLIFDRTIFYPQGGGQPSDSGWVEVNGHRVIISKVKWVGDEVRHYIGRDSHECVGKIGMAQIDQNLRQFHSRLHTSGHLISHIVEAKNPDWRASKGHHFPDQCYVEFTLKNANTTDEIHVEMINEEIRRCISENLATSSKDVSGEELQTLCPGLAFNIPKDQPVRVIRIGNFPFSPCGGTHVNHTEDLAGLEITKFKVKGKTLKLYYHITKVEN